MTSDQTEKLVPPGEVFSPEELNTLGQRIIASGELGRSKVYSALLTYLIECATAGTTPKEAEIAIDVLGRDGSFDATKDSAVRVYVHQLRKRLDQFYEKYDLDSSHRIVIPKGQYTIAAQAISREEAKPVAKARTRFGLPTAALALAVVLALNLVYFAFRDFWATDINQVAAAEHPLWEQILDDDVPITIVMGDYYIFAELDDAGNVRRMVREFDVNAKEDLERRFAENPQLAWRYSDLDLTYLPESSASALLHLLPVLQSGAKQPSIKMMSELTTQDLRSSHIVYLGYISGLGSLQNLLFAASNFRLGENYDELIRKDDQRKYISTAGMPSFGKHYVDYGLLATFPVSEFNQVVIVAGMRDEGLTQTAQAASRVRNLNAVDTALQSAKKSDDGKAENGQAFEALYEVRGMDRTNFEARLSSADYMDASALWGGQFGQADAR